MNCSGPTARSNVVSPSSRPRSVSAIRATPGRPSSAIPMILGWEMPSAPRRAPPYRPWLDSTLPIPAIRVQSSPQAGSLACTDRAAAW